MSRLEMGCLGLFTVFFLSNVLLRQLLDLVNLLAQVFVLNEYQISCTKPTTKLRIELPRIDWTYSNIDQYSFRDGYMFERITFSFPFRSWHVLNVFNLLNCFFNHFAFLMHDFFTSSPITYYSGTRFTDVSFFSFKHLICLEGINAFLFRYSIFEERKRENFR